MESACWRGISLLGIWHAWRVVSLAESACSESACLENDIAGGNRLTWCLENDIADGNRPTWCLENDIAGGIAADSVIPILPMLRHSLAKRSRCFKILDSLDSSAHTGLQYQSTNPTSETPALHTEYSEAEGARDGRISAGIRIETEGINASRVGL